MSTNNPRASNFADVEALAHLANKIISNQSALPAVPPSSAASSGSTLQGGAPVGSVVTPPDWGSELSQPSKPVEPVALPYEPELRNLMQPFAINPSSLESNSLAELPSVAPSPFYFLDDVLQGNWSAGGVGAHADRTLTYGDWVRPAYDLSHVRRDFPILQERLNGRPLVWLDNAATTQKPLPVIERLWHFYHHENSNVHRAAHELAARATDAYEGAREKVRGFLNASSVNEVVFVRGATEAINLVAQSWGRANINRGDEVIISWLEHHANIVPWQQLCEEKGAHLKVIPVDDDGQILIDEYAKLLSSKTKLVSFAHVSNALGTITPAKQMVEMAHAAGAKVLVDGAQSVSHLKVDVAILDCDWFVLSGHKLFAPTGIGVLYGKEFLLNESPPWQGGGNMIKDVTFERTLYQSAPLRFEAGTGSIADAVGLGAAVDYLQRIGMDQISVYENQLLHYATQQLKRIPGLRLIGTAPEKAGVLSFVLEGFKTEEVGTALNREGIAVRAGHHCAQPILRRFGLESTVRASLALYNHCRDIDSLVSALRRIRGSRSTF